MLVNREVILAKTEVTYGTDPTPTEATNAILVESPSWSNDGLRMIDRPAVRQSIGTLKKLYAGRLMTISFGVEIKGSGAAGTAPRYNALLTACGLYLGTDAGVSNSYNPRSTGMESCTIYYYQDGTLFILTGCRGNASFVFETGNKGMINFTMTGHVSALSDVALPTPTYASTVPPPILGATFTVGGDTLVINKFEFDLNNTVAKPPSIAESDGYGPIRITKRDVTGSFDPEHELVATKDFLGEFTAGTTGAVVLGTIGSAAGNIFGLTMPAIAYRDLSPGDREGVRTLEVPFGAAETATFNDEFLLTFT